MRIFCFFADFCFVLREDREFREFKEIKEFKELKNSGFMVKYWLIIWKKLRGLEDVSYCKKILQLFFYAMFLIRGDICILCFLQGLTPPLHPAPGTTRSDVTLARECQRLGASGCFSAKFSFCPPAYKSGWNAGEWAIKSSAGLATSGESKLSFYMLSHWHTPL